jgi:hypothetical protein
MGSPDLVLGEERRQRDEAALALDAGELEKF